MGWLQGTALTVVLACMTMNLASAQDASIQSSNNQRYINSLEEDLFSHNGNIVQLRKLQIDLLTSGYIIPPEYLELRGENKALPSSLYVPRKHLPFKTVGIEITGIWEGKVSSELLAAWKEQQGKCKHGVTFIDEYPRINTAKRCFNRLDFKAFQLLNEDSDGESSYLNGVKYVGSMVDKYDNHKCIASIYEPGTWITAAHCVDKNHLIIGLYLAYQGRKIPIEEDSVKVCTGCDIATFNLKNDSIIYNRSPLKGAIHIDHQNEIFVPGIPLNVKIDIASDANAVPKQLLWGPVGLGFCRVYEKKGNCILQTCSAVTGFSGAPLYTFDKNERRVRLVGVHSGSDETLSACDIKSEGVNYATAIESIKFK